MDLEPKSLPEYKVKQVLVGKKVKHVQYVIERPGGSYVNELFMDTEDEALIFLERLRSMRYCK